MDEIGILVGPLKSLILENTGELSNIEGNLMSSSKNKKIKTILVTSCSPREGKTVSAASMAYSLASLSNNKVLLIDGNFSTPAIHELFHVDTSPGLSDLLLFGSQLQDVIRRTDQENLMIMPLGSPVSRTTEAIEDASFPHKLAQIKDQFDYVIVDGCSVLSSSDVSLMCRHFDGIVFVIECNKTKWEVVQEGKDKLVSSGGNILGAVLNKRIYYIPKKLYGKI